MLNIPQNPNGQASSANSSPSVLSTEQEAILNLLATKAKQDLLLAELELKANLSETQPVSVSSLPLPTGAATAANQQTNAITDVEIRATPLPISGTVTANTGLSQPVTDTQLRATPVPVNGTLTVNAGTNLNTSALALETTQSLVKAKTDNLDVLLSTRLKPSDTLAGITTVGSVTAITNALPTGSNVIGKVGFDTANNLTTWDKTNFTQSVGNSSSSQLAASATFPGAIESGLGHPNLVISIRCDQPFTLTIKQYSDLAGNIAYPDIVYTRLANVGYNDTVTLAGSYFKITLQNTGASTTTNLFLETWLGILPVAQNSTNLGNAPIAINEVGGSAFTLGQKTSANSIPVISSSDDFLTGQSAQTATVNNILTATSGTSASDISAYRAFNCQVVSTGTAGTFIFEGSNDNVNFQAIPVYNQALVVRVPIVTAITASASSIIYEGSCNFRFLRLRIVTTITGGSIQAFTNLLQTPFGTTSQIVSNGTAANLLTTVSGTVTANGVAGTAAHSAAVSGNPVYTAGKVVPITIAGTDTSLGAGDVGGLPVTSGQQLVTKPFGTAELDITTVVSSVVTTTSVQQILPASGTASVRNYISGLVMYSDTLGAAGNAWILDGQGAIGTSVTIATPGVFTSTAHDLKVGDAIVFTSLGTITGVSTNTVYYITATSYAATTFTVATTLGGTAIQITGSSSAFTFYRVLHAIRLQTTALSVPIVIAFPTPLRGMANVAINLLIPSSLTSGSIYVTTNGYRGF